MNEAMRTTYRHEAEHYAERALAMADGHDLEVGTLAVLSIACSLVHSNQIKEMGGGSDAETT